MYFVAISLIVSLVMMFGEIVSERCMLSIKWSYRIGLVVMLVLNVARETILIMWGR